MSYVAKETQTAVSNELVYIMLLGKLAEFFVRYRVKPFGTFYLSEVFAIKGIQFILQLSCGGP